jgi:hypothetical protein
MHAPGLAPWRLVLWVRHKRCKGYAQKGPIQKKADRTIAVLVTGTPRILTESKEVVENSKLGLSGAVFHPEQFF